VGYETKVPLITGQPIFHLQCTEKYVHNTKMQNIETIGIRAFSQAVSSYLKKVQLGVRILISDRGRVIGELVQPGAATIDFNIPPLAEKLIADEMLSLGSSFNRKDSNNKDVYKFPRGASLSKDKSNNILNELRGEN
jgi:antitoxin (DNA-binding transcriptional repressor) of toxin-antitoxin stability system